MEYLRTFVAIDIRIGPTLKRKWDELKLLLKNDNIKWVDENTIHLTLFFLGNTPIKQIENIASILEQSLEKTLPFNLFLNGLGVFEVRKVPKAIWVGVSESQALLNLKIAINSILSEEGFNEAHCEFSPHLTLGRVKHTELRKELESFINKNNAEYFQEVTVETIKFYQSILTSSGPIYKQLKVFRLLSP